LFVFCLNSASRLGWGCRGHHEWPGTADTMRTHATKHKNHERNLQVRPALAIL
jgi:hypothetical protein